MVVLGYFWGISTIFYHISTTRGRRFLGLMPKFVVLQFLHSFTNMTPLDGENGITEVLRIVLD